MELKKEHKRLLLCLGIPLAVGALAALISGRGMKGFENLNQPPLTPPGWLFPVVWTILYLAMGWASCRIAGASAPAGEKKKALVLYGLQLAANFLWPILFFNQGWYLAAFLELILLWGLVLATMLQFSRIDSRSGDLLLPYLLWVTFALYLNFGVYVLNP